MHTIFPVVVLVAIGAAAGAVFHLRWPRFWLASLGAGLAASIIWVAGTFLLFWLAAPSELGPPLPEQLAKIFLTAFVTAIVVGWIVRRRKGKSDESPAPH